MRKNYVTKDLTKTMKVKTFPCAVVLKRAVLCGSKETTVPNCAHSKSWLTDKQLVQKRRGRVIFSLFSLTFLSFFITF